MCTRVSRVVGAIAFLAIPLVLPAAGQDTTPAQATATEQIPDRDTVPPLVRWLDAETFTASARYDYIEDARHRMLQNRMQLQLQLHPRFKIDPAGRYSVHAGLTTGDNFSSGWNAQCS